MEEGLINECYICLEQCQDTSPCACETRVHTECLIKFLTVSNNSICTICKTDYDLDSPMFRQTPIQAKGCNYIQKCTMGLFYSACLFIAYVLSGLAGQFIGNWLGITSDDPIKTIWTPEHALATFSLVAFVGMVYLIFGRCIRNTV